MFHNINIEINSNCIDLTSQISRSAIIFAQKRNSMTHFHLLQRETGFFSSFNALIFVLRFHSKVGNKSVMDIVVTTTSQVFDAIVTKTIRQEVSTTAKSVADSASASATTRLKTLPDLHIFCYILSAHSLMYHNFLDMFTSIKIE